MRKCLGGKKQSPKRSRVQLFMLAPLCMLMIAVPSWQSARRALSVSPACFMSSSKCSTGAPGGRAQPSVLLGFVQGLWPCTAPRGVRACARRRGLLCTTGQSREAYEAKAHDSWALLLRYHSCIHAFSVMGKHVIACTPPPFGRLNALGCAVSRRIDDRHR